MGYVNKWCLRPVVQISVIKKVPRGGKRKAIYPRRRNEGGHQVPSRRSEEPPLEDNQRTEEIIKRLRNEKFTKRMDAQKLEVYCGLDIFHRSINKILRKLGLAGKRKNRKQQKFDPFR